MTEINELEKAIAALEAQRAILGDAVVDTALAPMREKLKTLKEGEQKSEQELKYVTVLFADIAGSTKMGQDLDPEDTMTIMDGALQRYNDVIEANGGRVVRFMGDGLKAIFGVPVTYEDDAERAVYAGLAMLEETRSYAKQVEEEWGLSGFNLRVGINTGQVLLGGGVEADKTAMGMAINLGARMESSAPIGGLLISDETYKHVRGMFEVENQPPIMVKGKDEPMQTFVVLRAKRRSFLDTRRGVEGVATPMLGRDLELSQLHKVFESTLEGERTQIVTILGDAGVGKSRLLYEFELKYGARLNGECYCKGRATQQMRGTPYALLGDMFAKKFNILDSDPAGLAQEKFEAGLVGYFDEEAQMKAHFIGTLVGIKYQDSPHLRGVRKDPEQLRNRALFYLTQFFSALTERTPAVLFLDDIHWADGPSLDAITHIARERPNNRMLIICIARPELFERRPQWGVEEEIGSGIHTWIKLHPLPDQTSRQLVNEILLKVDQVPDRLCEMVVSSAEGNPFYLEELIKMMIDDKVITMDDSDNAWYVDLKRLQELHVPPSLTTVLQARIDSLPKSEKITLQQASVVGRIFWDAILKTLQEAKQPPRDEIRALTQREFILQQEKSTFAKAEEFMFMHNLMRDVTYGTVLKRKRQIYHSQVAKWLVGATQAIDRSDQYSGVIAEHYDLAGEGIAAAEWFIRAGERAKDQGSTLEARKFFDRALALLPQSEREYRWQALLGRNEVLHRLGETEAWEADDAALLALAMEMGDGERVSLAYFHKGYHAYSMGKDHDAIQLYNESLKEAERVDHTNLKPLVLSMKVISQTRLGDLEGAKIAAEAALNTLEGLKDDYTHARTLTNVAIYYSESGDLGRAIQLTNQSVKLNHHVGNRFGETINLSNLGYDYVKLGSFSQGRDALERSLVVAESIGARRICAYNRLNLGLAYWRMGENTSAKKVLELSIPELSAVGDSFGEGAGYAYIALVREQSGDISGAFECFEHAEGIYSEIDAQCYVIDALAGKTRCYLEQGKNVEAEKYGSEVWEYLQESGGEGMEFPILAYKSCVDVFKRLGDENRARLALELGYNELMNRAGKISNDTWRKSFVENVPEHRDIIERRKYYHQ